MFRKGIAAALLTVGAVALAPGMALADAIDGHWCKGVKILSIDGPKIVTPGGTTMQGKYDRHGFEYVAPAGEEDTGATVFIAQVEDGVLRLTRSAARDAVEEWHRCQKTVS